MAWKVSDPHDSKKDKRLGIHSDIYHVNEAGKRDQPHSTDLKIDNDPKRKPVQDIIPPQKSKK